jgi:hypothetical protein
MKTATAIIKNFSALLPFALGVVVGDGAGLERTCLAGAATADETEAPEALACTTGVPHFSQNFVPVIICEPHLVQKLLGAAASIGLTRRAPHFVQNASFSDTRAPHFSQMVLLIDMPLSKLCGHFLTIASS